MRFYKLIEVKDPLKYAYPETHHLTTLEERLGDNGACEKCNCMDWVFLPKGENDYRTMKPYVRCLCCGNITHL